jgi:hypothetical protein
VLGFHTLMNDWTCRLRLIYGRRRLQSKTVHLAKQPFFDCFDGLAVRCTNDVRVSCRKGITIGTQPFITRDILMGSGDDPGGDLGDGGRGVPRGGYDGNRAGRAPGAGPGACRGAPDGDDDAARVRGVRGVPCSVRVWRTDSSAVASSRKYPRAPLGTTSRSSTPTYGGLSSCSRKWAS